MRIPIDRRLGGGNPPHRGGAPPPPPPPGKGRHGKGGKGGKGGGGKIDAHRQQLIGNAISSLQGALLDRNQGFTPQQALLFARVLLTRPGVTITRDGVRYKGQRYAAHDFAATPLADFITGLKAKLDNENVIKGDPGYQADLATLGLNRDNSTAGLQEQYDRGILNYGDPAFAGNNTILGAQAAANPFSEAMLLSQAYKGAQSADAQNAAARGLMPGSGGYQAATQNTNRAYAGQLASGVQSLQDLLSTINQQRAAALQQYQVGSSTALQSAQQRLLASGQIHAATAPTLSPGRFRLYRPPRNQLGNPRQPHAPRIPKPPPPPR